MFNRQMGIKSTRIEEDICHAAVATCNTLMCQQQQQQRQRQCQRQRQHQLSMSGSREELQLMYRQMCLHVSLCLHLLNTLVLQQQQ